MSYPKGKDWRIPEEQERCIAEATGGPRDHRTCDHGASPKLGCLSCWVGGWLFDDRRNPAHPFHRGGRGLTISGSGSTTVVRFD